MREQDEYWEFKVRGYILREDFRRAFDTIKEARGKMPRLTNSAIVRSSEHDGLVASRNCLVGLITELHEALRGKGFIKKTRDIAEKIDPHKHKPGMTLAFKWLQPHSDWVLEPTGLMVLDIAAWASARRNAKRRRKIEQALRPR